MMMNIVYLGNQGGIWNLEFYRAMAVAASERSAGVHAVYLVWLESERDWLTQRGVTDADIMVFESWVTSRRHIAPDPQRLERDYPQAGWSAVAASERAFTDYSFLLGAVGNRAEKSDYVDRLIENVVTFFEEAIRRYRPAAFVCQTPDTLYSHCIFKVAKTHDVTIYAVSPGWLFDEDIGEGGFFSNDEYLRCDRMIAAYERIGTRALTAREHERIDSLLRQILGFSGRTAFYEKMRGAVFSGNVVSPNIRRALSYLRDNNALDKDALYIRIDPWQKLKANVLRFWRKQTTARLMQTVALEALPTKCVLYAMHFQPEQSTLAQGIFVANQIALIENISKALPLGYRLIVKEHPVGRGRRPAWQYRHIAGLPNVEMCDAPAKEIVKRCDLVMTVTGTIAIEALALGKAVVVFGCHFYSYCDLITTVTDPTQLHAVLHRLLIVRNVPSPEQYDARLRRFLLSYLDGLIPHFPLHEGAHHYGAALMDDLLERTTVRPRDAAAPL